VLHIPGRDAVPIAALSHAISLGPPADASLPELRFSLKRRSEYLAIHHCSGEISSA
jgi:hypothetical protein